MPCSTTLTPQHFNVLCNIPQVGAALLRSTQLVTTPAHCRQVQLNLRLHSLKKSWCADGGSGGLRGAVARRRAAVLEAEAQLAATAKDLANTGAEVMASEESASSWRRRRLVLECAGAQLVADTAACRRLTVEVEGALHHWQERLKGGEQRTDAQAVVSEVVGEVQHLRQALLLRDQDEDGLRQQKERLWSRVSLRAAEASSRALVAALAASAQQDTSELVRESARYDTMAQEGREGLEVADEDNSSDLPIARSSQQAGVRELLSLMCAAHVEAALDSTRLAEAATANAAARDAITASTRLAIRHQHPDQETSTAVTSLVQHGISAAGQRAALQVLQAALPRLQQEAAQTEREQAALRQQHDAVRTFEQHLRSNLHKLQCLSLSIERSSVAQREQARAARTAAMSALSELDQPSSVLPLSTLSTELELLATLPLTSLTTLAVPGRGAVLERGLTITTADTGADPRLQRVMDKVVGGSSCALSVECAAESVCSAHDLVCSLAARADQAAHTQAARRSNSAQALTSSALKELCERVDASDEQLEAAVDTALRACSDNLTRAQKAVPRTRQALQAWWEQPAKGIKL